MGGGDWVEESIDAVQDTFAFKFPFVDRLYTSVFTRELQEVVQYQEEDRVA